MAYAWGGLAEAGALYKSETTRGPGGGADNGTNMYINAAKSSSIYGSSSSVQPPSMARYLRVSKFDTWKERHRRGLNSTRRAEYR